MSWQIISRPPWIGKLRARQKGSGNRKPGKVAHIIKDLHKQPSSVREDSRPSDRQTWTVDGPSEQEKELFHP
jgi:hypothetical protein